MIPRRTLGAVIVAWAAVSWGGRIGLLTDTDAGDAVTWLRIGGSIVTALAVGAALILRLAWASHAAIAYAAVVAAVWTTSLVSVWGDASNDLGFRLVHTAIAVVSLALAVMALIATRQGETDTGGSGSTADGTAAIS